jgi:hypothetical protein
VPPLSFVLTQTHGDEILTQTHGDETRPVAYASRTLTAVERRYSQTERDALAVVWGCERFHLYLYGTTFDIYTGH